MTATIHKYEFPVQDEFELDLPAGAEILSVQEQNGVPVMWAKVDPSAEMVCERFCVRGTGHDASNVGEHIASFQLEGGSFVGHLFRPMTDNGQEAGQESTTAV